ncbi:MAG: carboxypeptidase-like regulatory domain-containing protein [Flavobacteriaceae bacterium]
MNKKTFNFFLFTVLISFISIAQEFELKLLVLDSENDMPLESVNVLLDSSKGGGITDLKGIFKIKLPSRDYKLSLEYLGYANEELFISLNKNLSLVVKMEVFEEKLSEIIVRAKNLNENVETPQMGVFNITSEELVKIPSAFGEFDVLKSITLMAGVNNAGDVSNGISVRGGSLDQNLMLYESAPVFNPTHLFGLLSVFTPDIISKLDMYQANIPSKYGGRISSVMDIKVKNPYSDKLELNGGIGLLSSRLKITAPILKDKLLISTALRGGFTDFLFPVFVKRLKNTKANFYDGTMKLLYLVNENNQVSYNYFTSNDFYQLDLISNVEKINSEFNQYDFGTSNHTLKWLHNFKNNTTLKSLYINSTYLPKNLFPEFNSSNVIVFKSKVNYSSFQLEYMDSRGEEFNYSLGIQTKKYIISPGSLSPGSGNSVLPVNLEKENSLDFSSYFNLNFNPSKNLSFSLGLRHTLFNFLGPYSVAEYNDNGDQINSLSYDENESIVTYKNFEPRIGSRIQLNKNSSLKFSYAKINQYIQNIYNTVTPLPTSRWKTSDTYIKPQVSDTFGAGIFKNFDSMGIELSLEGYYRDIQNTLTYKPGADFFLSEYVEKEVIQGLGKAYGIEFSLKKPVGKFNGFLNYTWARSLLKTNESNFKNRINNNDWYASDFDRPHTFNATLTYESDIYNEFSFNFTAQSGRPYTIANTVFEISNIGVPIYLQRNNSRFPNYQRLDFSWKVSYSRDPKKRFKKDWIFTVYNVLGRKNPFNIYYTQRDGTSNDGLIFGSSPLASYTLSVIKTPIISLTYNFRFK